MDAERFDKLATVVGKGCRRQMLLRGVAGGVIGSALVAGQLAWGKPVREAAARGGGLDGQLGGRHGKNRRGRNKRRSRDDNTQNSVKDNDRGQETVAHGWCGELRNCATVAKVPGADLSKCNLHMADLRLADLRGANFHCSHLAGANLSGAKLSDANFTLVFMPTANLTNADLSRSNIFRSDLELANMTGTILTDTVFCHTIMPNGKERNDTFDC